MFLSKLYWHFKIPETKVRRVFKRYFCFNCFTCCISFKLIVYSNQLNYLLRIHFLHMVMAVPLEISNPIAHCNVCKIYEVRRCYPINNKAFKGKKSKQRLAYLFRQNIRIYLRERIDVRPKTIYQKTLSRIFLEVKYYR